MVKVSDYRNTMRLLATSAIALVIMATFVRQTGSGVQSSFYGVWLSEELGLTGTTIGFLIGFGNFGFGSVRTHNRSPDKTSCRLLVATLYGRFRHCRCRADANVGRVVAAVFCNWFTWRGSRFLNLPLMISIAVRRWAQNPR